MTDLVLEHLKRIQADISDIKTDVRDLKTEAISTRILGLQEIEWVVSGGHSTGSMHEYWLSEAWSRAGIRHDEAWRNRASDSSGCQTGIRSLASARKRPCAVCSVTGMC